MKQYEEYRDSNIEWLGNIPKHWNVKRIKDCCNIIMGQSPNGEDIDFEGKTPFMQGNSEFTEYTPKTTLFCEKCSKFSRIGDILLSVRAPVGEINYSDKIYGIGRGLCSIKTNNGNSHFLWFFLKQIKPELEAISTGTTFRAISTQQITNYYFIFPPLTEQTAIANYLDEKTAQIDSRIALLNRKADLYRELRRSLINTAVTHGLNPNAPTKPSNIDWLGDIPAHWELKRVKDICLANTETLSEKTPKDTIIKYTEISDVTYEDGIKCYSEMPFEEAPSRARRITHNKDIIISTVRTYLKAVAYIQEDDLIVSTGFDVLTPTKRIFSRYLYYAALNDFLINKIQQLSVGVSYPAITEAKISSISLPLPPLKEQIAIANYLDEKTTQIDNIISQINQQTKQLAELRRSLIDNVVTGKIKITED